MLVLLFNALVHCMAITTPHTWKSRVNLFLFFGLNSPLQTAKKKKQRKLADFTCTYGIWADSNGSTTTIIIITTTTTSLPPAQHCLHGWYFYKHHHHLPQFVYLTILCCVPLTHYKLKKISHQTHRYNKK